MYRQARLLTARPLGVQRLAHRTYAITPNGAIPPSTAAAGLPPKPPSPIDANVRPVPIPVTATVAPIPAKPVVIAKPVVVTTTTNTTTTGTSDLPPPPPPPPSGKPKSNWGRKLFIYLTLGTLVFYPTSALISTHSDRYRDFFTSSFPLAETLVDYADENNWDELTPGSIVTGAQGLGNKVAGTTVPPETQKTSVEKTAQRTAERTKEAVKETGKSWSDKIDAAQTKASQKLESARSAISSSTDRAEKKTVDEAAELKREAKVAAAKTSSSAAKAAENIKAEAKHVVEVVKEKTAAAVEKLPTMPQFSEGVTDLASKAEAALEGAEKKAEGALVKAEKKAEGALAKAENKIEATEKKVEAVAKEAVRNKGGPVVDPAVQAQLVDTQRPRDVKANTAPKAALVEEKKPWTGAPLPLGFEPPAGYYIPKPEKKKDSHGVPIDPIVAADPKTEGTPVVKHNLPLLAPRVAEFTSAKEEPIIAQLASTIDSLASSLSATSSAATSLTSDSNPEHVLSRAQTDLSSLSQRLQALKDEEKAKLQKIAEQKKNEFETELKTKEKAWENKEGEMMNGWKEEREKLVEGWRKVLDRELEGQRVGIEQRLREEVIAQGIELQRRWLRSIKAQVEQERGGRLAKLDSLTTSFKQLERITLDNSTQLDANVSLHTLWSALRAVQAKVDKGGVAFDDELRVLKTAANAAASSASDDQSRSLISAMITSIEQSHAATEGIKSFPALSSWFTSSLAPKIQSVSLVPAEHEAGVLSHLASAGLSKILFRPRAGWVEGDDVGAVLARAEYLLNEKDLDGAARQVNQLQGWAGKLAGDWLREARKRLEVEQALQVLATEATLSSLLLV